MTRLTTTTNRTTKVKLGTVAWLGLVLLICVGAHADASVSFRRASSSTTLAFQGTVHPNRILRRANHLVPTAAGVTALNKRSSAGSSLLFRRRNSDIRMLPTNSRRTTTRLSAGPVWSVPLLMRGGALSAKSLLSAVSASKKLCWVALLISILAENMGTSLSKHSRDIGSVALFAAACCINLLRYERFYSLMA